MIRKELLICLGLKELKIYIDKQNFLESHILQRPKAQEDTKDKTLNLINYITRDYLPCFHQHFCFCSACQDMAPGKVKLQNKHTQVLGLCRPSTSLCGTILNLDQFISTFLFTLPQDLYLLPLHITLVKRGEGPLLHKKHLLETLAPVESWI